MRLFIFAIGGSGSRVLKSMIMQFAAGVIPVDANGNRVKNLTVVPIIIDPHQSNDAVQSTNKLLDNYRKIRQDIYGDRDVDKGFFAVKIDTLRNVSSSEDSQYQFNDGFIYEMPEVSSNKFEDFINIDSMSPEDKLFSKMIFSDDELSTVMSEGFYGSPNIGTVALNVFRESDNFKALVNCMAEGDRLFFIGSIFGGTGAAGMPMFISSIRQNRDSMALAHAPIGALVVMPYFAIEQDDDSQITQADFMIKTQTALRYYVDNLNPYVNSLYYVADTQSTQAFRNDPGKDGQSTNKSHFVEFLGGLAIDDFAGRIMRESDIYREVNGTVQAGEGSRETKQFSLVKGVNNNPFWISFLEFDDATRKLIMLPMMKYHLMTRFVINHLEHNESQGFAKNNSIMETSMTNEFRNFLAEYEKWLNEMRSHGDHAHNLWLFADINAPMANNFTSMFNRIQPQRRTFGSKSLDVDDIIHELNKNSDAMRDSFTDNDTPMGKFMKMADPAIEQVILDNLEIKNLK